MFVCLKIQYEIMLDIDIESIVIDNIYNGTLFFAFFGFLFVCMVLYNSFIPSSIK